MSKRDTDKPNDKAGASLFGLSPTRVAQAFFSRRIRIQRGAKGLKLVLEGANRTSVDGTDPIVSDETVQALLMHSDLTALLDGAKGSRRVLRHLAAVEHGLEHKDSGALFLFDVPAQRLETALRQLDGLIVGSMSPGLAALRSRLLDAIAAQEMRERRRVLQEPISSFLVDHKLEVVEAGITDFDLANAAWQPTLPAQPDAERQPEIPDQIKPTS